MGKDLYDVKIRSVKVRGDLYIRMVDLLLVLREAGYTELADDLSHAKRTR